jgi:hypothetical protein
MEEDIKRITALGSLSIKDFTAELSRRIYKYEEDKTQIIKRQIELEQCIYTLLCKKKPTFKDYNLVAGRLSTIQEELRNPDLYMRALHRITEPIGNQTNGN